MNRDQYIFPSWNAPANIQAMTTTRAAPFPPTMPTLRSLQTPTLRPPQTPTLHPPQTPTLHPPQTPTLRGLSAESIMPGSRGQAAGRREERQAAGRREERQAAGRREERQAAGRREEISWLTQVHGNTLLELHTTNTSLPEADGSFTSQPGVVCVVKTADCLPVLLTNRRGDFVAALHCGWRGLHADLIAKAVAQAGTDSELLAWIGPAISQAQYEVDAAFQARFCAKDSAYTDAFLPRGDKYLANLPAIAEHQLRQAGVTDITPSGICSFCESDKCHSFRRDGDKSGRMATLIWFDAV